jgi:hypothetical protein
VKEGVDTGESTIFPNRANGKIYGIYEIHKGLEAEEYECSDSVIDSAPPRGRCGAHRGSIWTLGDDPKVKVREQFYRGKRAS